MTRSDSSPAGVIAYQYADRRSTGDPAWRRRGPGATTLTYASALDETCAIPACTEVLKRAVAVDAKRYEVPSSSPRTAAADGVCRGRPSPARRAQSARLGRWSPCCSVPLTSRSSS